MQLHWEMLVVVCNALCCLKTLPPATKKIINVSTSLPAAARDSPAAVIVIAM
jgi:hypothetical protein